MKEGRMATREEQFEAFLKDLKVSDAIKTTLREGAKGDPEVMNACLRQSDYDRFMNESKTKLATADKWITWADENVPIHEKMVVDFDNIKNELEQARSGKEINMTDAELATKVEGILKTKGLTGATATQEQIGQAVTKAVAESIGPVVDKKAGELRDNFLKNDLPSSMDFIGQVMDCQMDYKDDFNKKLDRQGFIKFIVDGKYDNVQTAYKAFTAADQQKKAEADQKAHDEKIAEDARQKERELLRNQTVPGSTSLPPDATQGPVLQFINKGKETAEGATATPPASFRPGSGAAAVAAAAELRGAGRV